MVLLILEPSVEPDQVPGTQTSQHRQANETLKHLPIPSHSSADPLNWPTSRKNLILGLLCAQSILGAALNPILATNTFQLVFSFGTTFTKIALLTGYNVLALGLSALFFSASCRIYGRRHTFLIGSVLMVAGCFWAANADSYNSLLGARILQGIGTAPFEGLIQVVVADMYFVSDRGRAFAVVSTSYLGGNMITPIITGKLSQSLGRRAPFYLVGGFSTFFMIILFFFLEETAFDRTTATTVEEINMQDQNTGSVKSSDTSGEKTLPKTAANSATHQSEDRPSHQVKTFVLARLSLFSKRYSNDSFVKLVFRPVLLCAHPAIAWGSATVGLVTAWLVMLATVVAGLFASAPHFYGPAKIGYLYTGPFIGAILALPLSGLLSDSIARTLTKRYGVYEPEYRIFLTIPFTIAAAIGLFGFGYTIDDNPVIPAIFFGFVLFAVVFSFVAVGTYTADAYQSLSVDCFIAFILVKNLLAFGLTMAGLDWLNRDGARKMFVICGSTQLGVCALSIPMYIFGKVIRKWSAESAFWRRTFA